MIVVKMMMLFIVGVFVLVWWFFGFFLWMFWLNSCVCRNEMNLGDRKM